MTESTMTAGSGGAQGPAGWLRAAPINDPVDRRNAPMLQVVLLLLGGMPPLVWLYRVVGTDIPWRQGELHSMAISLMISAFALFGLALIRKGRFQWAIRQTLVLIALSMILAYAKNGTAAQSHEQLLQVVWMVLAGLLIGRRALWLMYAAVVIAFAAGGLQDVRLAANPIDTPANAAVSALISSTVFLLIALVIDRGVRALRESLAAATRRGDALALAKQQLEAEMAEREKVQNQLIHAQKVEAVGRLASGVAHDFNHLLSLILGYAAKGRDCVDIGELKGAMAGIEAAGRRGTAVTHKLLDFSRHEVTRFERFDLGDAVHDLKPMLRQLFDPQVQIRYSLPEIPIPVEFDRAQLDLILLNLAANANQAMPDGGHFDLTVRMHGDTHAELELRDSGHGMDESVRKRIFDPFFTTRASGQGTGLGLYVARQLITAADGDISVESETGQGATFRIRLPLLTRVPSNA